MAAFAPGSASAAEKPGVVRYERPAGKGTVKPKEKLSTKFEKEVAEQAARDKRPPKMIKGADLARKRKTVERKIADRQITQLERLLKATPKDEPEYPDLVFRLADHELDKKAYFEFREGTLHERIYQAEEKGDKATAKRLRAQQKKMRAAARTAGTRAVELYKHLTSEPKLARYKRIDEALYFMAFELGQLGREEEMKAAYVKLIQDHTSSAYIPNAYLSFADYYFGKSQIQDALRLYDKVITFKDSPVYAYALYKIAWCHLNPIGTADPRYDLSLQFFIDTITATLEGRAGSEENARQLRRDARRDLIPAYVHVGSTTKAQGFFEKYGDGPADDERMSRKMLELLAVRYFGNGKYTESTFVYHKLQELYPEDAQTCEWQGRVVINALATDNKAVQWKEAKALGDHWTRFKGSAFSTAVRRKCRDETLDTMKQMATVWHDEADKTKNPETYDLAEKAYRGFLGVFPKDKETYELQRYYAELLWARATELYKSKSKTEREQGRQKFRQAHDEFVKVLEMRPEGKHTQDAAYAQMLAMKNYLEYDETGGKGVGCKTNAEGVCERPANARRARGRRGQRSEGEGAINVARDYPVTDYTEDEKGMIRAYELYRKYVTRKGDKELPKINHHLLLLMMKHNRFDEARPLAQQMVSMHDGTIYAAWSAEMLLDVLTIAWQDSGSTADKKVAARDELYAWTETLEKTKAYKHAEAERVREAVPRLQAGIRWQVAYEHLLAGREGEPGRYRECAFAFMDIYNDYGDEHERADTLIWNATQCYEAAYLLGQAVKYRKLLLERFPGSKHAKETLDYLGGNYQSVAMYDRAAEHLERYADTYKSDERSAEKLQNAYLFRLGLGQADKADAVLGKFEGFYRTRNPEKAASIFWSKYDTLTSDAQRMEHARAYLRTYAKKGGVDRRIVAEATLGRLLWQQSCSRKGVLYESCMTIKRRKAKPGEKDRERKRMLRRRARQAKKRSAAASDGGSSTGSGAVKLDTRCGTATSGLITVHARNKKLARDAQKHFATVLSLAKQKVQIEPDEARRIEDYRNAVAMARVFQADIEYEEYLTVEMPTGLNFHVDTYKKDSGIPKWEREFREQEKRREDSTKRFKAFFERKLEMGQRLIESYDGVVAAKQSPAWMLAAAARSAMVSQNFADQLYRAEVPSNFKTEEEVFAFCDELGDRAAPVEQAALKKFTYCLGRSQEYQYFNEFSRLCEAELQQRDPDKYPSTEELFGESAYTAARPDRVSVQLDLEGERRVISLTGGAAKANAKAAN